MRLNEDGRDGGEDEHAAVGKGVFHTIEGELTYPREDRQEKGEGDHLCKDVTIEEESEEKKHFGMERALGEGVPWYEIEPVLLEEKLRGCEVVDEWVPPGFR